MIRYGEATHALDVDQRRIPLQVVSQTANADGSTTWQLAIPSDPGVAVPGEYMLFAIDSAGTPSVSTMVMVSGPTPPAPSDDYGKAVLSDSPAIYWPLQDSSGPVRGRPERQPGDRDLHGRRRQLWDAEPGRGFGRDRCDA